MLGVIAVIIWLPLVSSNQFHHDFHHFKGWNFNSGIEQYLKGDIQMKHVDRHLLQVSTYGRISKRYKRSIISETNQQADNTAYLKAKQFAYATGDFILGALFAVHIPDSDSQLCAKVLQRSGMWVESVLYAIDVINNNTEILDGTQLGFEIRDDCSDPNKALEVGLFLSGIKSTLRC